MKIYFQNKAARLKSPNGYYTCARCPFNEGGRGCPLHTSINVDCDNKGWWIDGELLDIFEV